MIKRFVSIATVVAVPCFFGLTSCASLFSDYCDKQMSCIGGNDNDRDACVSTLRGQEKAASDYNCSDQFDAYYECRNNTATCNAGKFDTNCDGQKKNFDDCVKANSTIR